jgi:hypothetical protein
MILFKQPFLVFRMLILCYGFTEKMMDDLSLLLDRSQIFIDLIQFSENLSNPIILELKQTI